MGNADCRSAVHARRLFINSGPAPCCLIHAGRRRRLKLGLEFQAQAPGTHIIIMTGGGLSDEE